jgi:hypothetical protein
VAPEKVVCALGTTQLTLTSYLGEVPAGTPNTTASFTEDEMAAQLKTHLTAMRDAYMVGGGDPELFERSGSTFDFRISWVDRSTLDQDVLDTIMDYTIQETATNLSLTQESISGNTLTPPKEAGASLVAPSLPDINIRLNSGPVTIQVDNPTIGGETVTSTGSVDTSTLGAYTITYSATDAAGNTGTATRTVTVQDTVAPVITINGAATINLTQGDTYTEAGATATDNSGEAISVVTDNSAVDTSAAGTYTVTYSATDSSGNQGTATRSVVVASAEP